MRKLLRKVRRWMTKMAKEHENLRGPLRYAMNFYRLVRYKLGTMFVKVDEKTVIFASFAGNAYSDNPKALFEYMIRDERFTDYTFVWGFKKGVAAHRRLLKNLVKGLYPDVQEIGDGGMDIVEDEKEKKPVYDQNDQNAAAQETEHVQGPKVVVVKYGGKTWRKYLARSKYWFFNFKVEDFLKPKKDQVFLQTWHGTPLKRLGYDLEHFDNVLNTEAGMKKRYGIEVQKFDYFISPSPFATEKFRSAWRMDDFGKHDIILEEGYPRNDILSNYTQEYLDEIKVKRFGYYYLQYEKLIKKKTIVLYAPTYRSNQHETGVGYVYKEEIDFDRMQSELGDDFIILFRAHYFVANRFNFSKYPGFVYNVSKVEDINELYLISDILITDYSSTMFDYAILKRPMIFYMYDLEHYRDESNGFYFDPEEELPGPIVKTEYELFEALKKAASGFVYDEKYRKFNEKFDPLDDGCVCERVVDKIFKKETV